jgi:thiamine kinase-like enzyme
MSPDEDRARRTLASLSLFPAESLRSAAVIRLSGLTNEVFKVEIAGESLCLRIPGAGTSAIIDRRREETNARAAALAGVAPEVLHSSADGVMLTRFIEGAPLSPRRFSEDPAAVGRAVRALAELHYRAEDFAGTFDVFERIGFYRDLLERRGAPLTAVQDRLLEKADPIRVALASQPALRLPCHCDPTGRNLLDSGDRIWLIDWEYSAMNDPMWDLAYLAIEADFDADQDQALLAEYFGRPACAAEAARMALFRPLCQLLSALWGLVQHSAGNRAVDFQGYAEITFARAGDRMRNDGFARDMSTLSDGG